MYSQTLSAAKMSGPPSAASIELPAIRIATTRATMAQNSVVLNACLVSVARRRVALPRAPPGRRMSAPVALWVAMRWNSFVRGWFVLLKESRLRQGVTGRVFPCRTAVGEHAERAASLSGCPPKAVANLHPLGAELLDLRLSRAGVVEEKAPIHRQGHASDVGGGVRAEEQHRAGTVLWSSDVVERQAGDHRVERNGVRALEVLLDHVGHEQRRGDFVDADPVLADLGRRRPRQVGDRGLAQPVDGLCLRWPKTRHRRGVDYRPAAVLAHVSDLVTQAYEDALRIDGHLRVEILLGGIHHADIHLAPGVVDCTIQTSVGFDGRVHQRGDIRLTRNVSPHERPLATGLPDQIDGLLPRLLAPSRDHDLGARAPELDGSCATDSARRPSNDRHLAVEQQFH